MILPPLYYGMHRFQTLLRKRQQTLCLRSFSKRCRDCLRSEKKKNKTKKQKKKQTKVQKSSVPPWEGTLTPDPWGKKTRGEDGAKASKLRFLCTWRAQTRGLRTLSGDVVFLKHLDLNFAKVESGSHSAADNTECYLLVFLVSFSLSMLWALWKTQEARKGLWLDGARLWGMMGKHGSWRHATLRAFHTWMLFKTRVESRLTRSKPH